MSSPKIEIIDEKPNFKELFNMTDSKTSDITKHKQTTDDNDDITSDENINKNNNDYSTSDNKHDNKHDNKQVNKQVNKQKTTNKNKYKHVIIMIVCALTVLIFIVLFIYYFVTMRKSKVELLRLSSDCENYKNIADETTKRENNIISMYETEKSDLHNKIIKMEQEIKRLTDDRNKQNKSNSIMKKQRQKHTTRTSIPSTNNNNENNKPKIELIDEDEQQTNNDYSEDEGENNNNNEYNISVPKYEEAPTSDKNKVVSPAQQVKNIINNKANRNFKNKMTAIQSANEVVDNYEDEQIEYSTQLGLNKSRQINTEKLNNVIAKMEKAVDDNISDDEINQQAIDENDNTPIDSLIVNN